MIVLKKNPTHLVEQDSLFILFCIFFTQIILPLPIKVKVKKEICEKSYSHISVLFLCATKVILILIIAKVL
jgi:hypothetical protein